MPRQARKLSESGLYHVVNRGISRQLLFEEREDYLRYLETLKRVKEEEHFDILAYCLMENHVHLLFRTDSLDRIMKRITCSYAYYFNNKYERTGHLFQDRYRSEPIDDDSYLLAVVRYIHNNPPKAGVCPREAYPWSSWHEYTGEPSLVSTSLVLDILGGREEFLTLSASNEEIECLEVSDSFHTSDRQALRLIREELHLNSGTQLQTMDRSTRGQYLHVLLEHGLSIRQIERLTGINRGIISRL